MLIYARNQTFCSKSVNKAPKIFFVAFLAIILEKHAGIKINFLCILLFYEFLMYFFVFFTFSFVGFFGEICGRHFLKHNNAKTNSFQPLRVKISIFIWTMWKKKINLHWFCTQNHILEPFSVRRACTKSYITSEPYPRASQIWCQNVRETWKKKVIKCRGESFARCRVITRNVEGGGPFRPPQSF